MLEYGGYIEFEFFHGTEFHENAIALNSGRHCVEYLIKAKGIETLLLPYFMCDSVESVCNKLGVNLTYYHTDDNFLPVVEDDLCEKAWLYVVNYYGQISNRKIAELKKRFDNVIVDNVQSFFQMPVDGVDTLYSCRKFFGVADGGYLYTDTLSNIMLEQDCSYDKMTFLFGRLERSANEFYSQYVQNNKRFESEPMKSMSRTTRNILRCLDYDRIEKIRTDNFSFLDVRFKHMNQLDLRVPKGAFMYPLYIHNGYEVRKQLQQENIYIPTLWPDVFERCKESEVEYDMARNILPLPVDQRYTTADMNYIAGRICEILEEVYE